MPAFPLFIDLENKSCVVFGGGPVAFRKVLTLKRFGASIRVFADSFCEPFLEAQKKEESLGVLKVCRWDPQFPSQVFDCIGDAFLVVCATGDRVFNQVVADYCKSRNIWVNCAVESQASSFVFPAVTVRGDVVAAVTTSGAVPALTSQIRQNMDELLPEWYGPLLLRLKELRIFVLENVENQMERKNVMNRLVTYGMAHEGEIPDEAVWNILKNEGSCYEK